MTEESTSQHERGRTVDLHDHQVPGDGKARAQQKFTVGAYDVEERIGEQHKTGSSGSCALIRMGGDPEPER